MKRISLLLISVILIGCSPEWHLKRAIKKNPSLVDTNIVVRIDTLIVTDSVHRIDSFVTKQIDTIIIHHNKGYTKIIRHFDTLRVEQRIYGDTIRIIKEVKVPQIIYKEDKSLTYIWYGVILLVLLLILSRILR